MVLLVLIYHLDVDGLGHAHATRRLWLLELPERLLGLGSLGREQMRLERLWAQGRVHRLTEWHLDIGRAHLALGHVLMVAFHGELVGIDLGLEASGGPGAARLGELLWQLYRAVEDTSGCDGGVESGEAVRAGRLAE